MACLSRAAIAAAFLCVLVPLQAQEAPAVTGPDRSDEFGAVVRFIGRFQYEPQVPEEGLAVRALQRYARALDPQRIFLTQDDATAYEVKRDRLAFMFANRDLSVPRELSAGYAQRVKVRLDNAIKLVATSPGDQPPLTGTAREDDPFLTGTGLDQRWAQIVNSELAALKRDGASDASARESLTQRYRSFEAKLLDGTSRNDARFIDAYARAAGAGTAYLERVDEVPGFVQRLGITVGEDTDGPIVGAVEPTVSRRPADLNQGDRILAVASGVSEPVSMDGWTATAAARALIRATQGASTVHLTIRRHGVVPGGPIQRVDLPLTAELDKFAPLQMVPAGPAEQHLGLITIRTLYENVAERKAGKADYTSVARDVRGLLEKASSAGTRGIVLDLRGSGGGSLQEAADVASLFVGKRPLWRIKRQDKTDAFEGQDETPVWRGPVVVLVDGATAEGAELLAGALQDNGRALILGSRSAGIGHIENLIDLRRFSQGQAHPVWGELRLNIGMAFRDTGESLNGHGITPDIAFPFTARIADDVSQRTYTSIESVPVTPMVDLGAQLPALKNAHAAKAMASTDATAMTEIASILSDLGKRPSGL